jgi:hypothetical protein
MPKDLIHHGGWEHRDVHNINGMFLPKVTSEGLIARGATPRRPFVLTRSFFAGSQRYGTMWAGDNLGTWEHMAVGIKMVLSNEIAGMTFGGCSSVTQSRKCSCDGTGWAHSRRSSVRTHIWTASAANRISSTNPTRAPCATFCACVIPSCLCGTPHSTRPVSLDFPSCGACSCHLETLPFTADG